MCLVGESKEFCVKTDVPLGAYSLSQLCPVQVSQGRGMVLDRELQHRLWKLHYTAEDANWQIPP